MADNTEEGDKSKDGKDDGAPPAKKKPPSFHPSKHCIMLLLAAPAWPQLGNKFKASIPAAAVSATSVGGPSVQSPSTPSYKLPLTKEACELIERTMRGFEMTHHRNMELIKGLLDPIHWYVAKAKEEVESLKVAN